MTSPLARISLLIAIVALVVRTLASQAVFSPLVPRAWDEGALATLEVPLPNPQYSPRAVPVDYYYRIPVRPIHRGYPVYVPGREPEGYFAELQRREPEIVWDDRTRPRLETKADWIAAGEAVFEAAIFYDGVTTVAQIRDPAWHAQVQPPATRDGRLPFTTYVIRQKGKVELGNNACGFCHTRVLPGGAVVKGAQGNFPFDRAVAAGLGARDVQQVRQGFRALFAAPWLDADPARDIDALPLEEHGPHLLVGADTLAMLFEAEHASRRVSRALAEWTIVLMPPLHYGQGGANQIAAARLVHPGTYALRQSTLRSLVADLGASVAQNGFRWIFVINGHGAPTHNLAINQACDFVSGTFGVTMLHLTALFRADQRIQALGEKVQAKHFSRADLASFGMDVHAGVGETAGMLAVRPDLVRRTYRTLPAQSGRTLEELRTIASTPDWQGYFSAPAKATAAYGRDVEAWWVEGLADLILRAVKGENLLQHPRVPDRIPPAMMPMLQRVLEEERAFESKLDRWLAQQPDR